jgi:hypothetical protein
MANDRLKAAKDGRLLFALVLFAFVVSAVGLVFSLCAPVEPTVPPPPAPKPPGVGDAVAAALDDFFSGKWNYGKVYVQAGPHIPPDLDRVGGYEAEVISESELVRRFAGQRVAPAFAWVRAEETNQDGKRTIVVSFDYTGLPVPGAEEVPLGGGAEYTYEVRGLDLVLVQQSREEI